MLVDWKRQKYLFSTYAEFDAVALQHILGHFGDGQLPLPYCSWASLLGSLPVLSAHSFATNKQLLFLNQRKKENGRRIEFDASAKVHQFEYCFAPIISIVNFVKLEQVPGGAQITLADAIS